MWSLAWRSVWAMGPAAADHVAKVEDGVPPLVRDEEHLRGYVEPHG